MVKEKYSVGEYERRFLLDKLPPGRTNPRYIVDHYVNETRLRLRTVSAGENGDTDLKLGHKRRVVADDPTAIRCTSIYLDKTEFAVLSNLPGRRLVKTRWAIALGRWTGAVEVFEEALSGLVMLEVDLGDVADLKAFEPPDWAGPEVTQSEAFTGAELAGRTWADVAETVDRMWAAEG